MNKWISVNDRLPDDFHKVLVYIDKPLKYGQRIFFSNLCQGEWNNINGSSWPDMPKVTHWMPLPVPPNSENFEPKTQNTTHEG